MCIFLFCFLFLSLISLCQRGATRLALKFSEISNRAKRSPVTTATASLEKTMNFANATRAKGNSKSFLFSFKHVLRICASMRLTRVLFLGVALVLSNQKWDFPWQFLLSIANTA